MGAIVKSNYTEEQWDKAKTLVIEKPELSLVDIADMVKIPVAIIENRSIKNGWINQRDLAGAKVNINNLNRIIQEVAVQLNDVHQHTQALIESLQYSHRIKIVKDDRGDIHYRNFDEFPGQPENWKDLTDEQKEVLLRYIAPSRFTRFMADLMTVLSLKNNNINFITKMIKGGLPKVDPTVLNISRRDTDTELMDGIAVFNLPVEEPKTTDVEKEEKNDN